MKRDLALRQLSGAYLLFLVNRVALDGSRSRFCSILRGQSPWRFLTETPEENLQEILEGAGAERSFGSIIINDRPAFLIKVAECVGRRSSGPAAQQSITLPVGVC